MHKLAFIDLVAEIGWVREWFGNNVFKYIYNNEIVSFTCEVY